MRFSFLTGDVDWVNYGGKWVSQELNNGDFSYWLVIEFTNFVECTGETLDGFPYHVQINAVAPSQVSAENLGQAFGSAGIEEDQDLINDLMRVEALDSYGVKAVLWQQTSKNAYKLLREAKKQAQVCEGLFGFFMDSPKNRIGTTGWEAIRGDLNSALARTIASGSVEGRILGKMHGLTDADIADAVSQSKPGNDGGPQTPPGTDV
jgi:hypothetical protein